MSVNSNEEQLIDDLQTVLTDTEELLRDAVGETGEKARLLRSKIAANLQTAKAKLGETERLVSEKAKEAAKVTDEYVHDHPWQSIGIAAGVGFLLGMLVCRR
ncbi:MULTISPECIES: DUF883 family protein [Silvimonas]|uniref:DUF883 family protein n=1 Tax=Silvimonas TaxID=300264 RepID=UPI0024B33D0D|nr:MULTISPECIES: DUF883 family protein [Silvimonas]MDR3430148.1 DUF883 family protein [Silvimonas sp.]